MENANDEPVKICRLKRKLFCLNQESILVHVLNFELFSLVRLHALIQHGVSSEVYSSLFYPNRCLKYCVYIYIYIYIYNIHT